MKKFAFGTKVGMTQILGEDGIIIPVTVLKVDPSLVVETCLKEKHGFDGSIIGYGDIKEKHLSKPKAGYFSKHNCKPRKLIKGVKISGFDQNSEINVDVFEGDVFVNIRAKTIGHGFTGTIKRHNFSRGPMTHGSKSHRLPGSIGAGTSPGRVFKGTRMGGRDGNKYITVKNLKVVSIDKEKGLLLVKGAVPGKRNNLLEIFN